MGKVPRTQVSPATRCGIHGFNLTARFTELVLFVKACEELGGQRPILKSAKHLGGDTSVPLACDVTNLEGLETPGRAERVARVTYAQLCESTLWGDHPSTRTRLGSLGYECLRCLRVLHGKGRILSSGRHRGTAFQRSTCFIKLQVSENECRPYAQRALYSALRDNQPLEGDGLSSNISGHSYKCWSTCGGSYTERAIYTQLLETTRLVKHPSTNSWFG